MKPKREPRRVKVAPEVKEQVPKISKKTNKLINEYETLKAEADALSVDVMTDAQWERFREIQPRLQELQNELYKSEVVADIEPIIELDRQTGVDIPELEGERSPFFQNPEETAAYKKLYEERAKAVSEDPELFTQKLINDVKLGKINCVVVYKVDRLSRSLLDFTRLLEFFDEYKVAFASVTQHFNTESSMGRLTLNILLSFAQFEREMISERTRDKMAAARKKGKWTGGVPPLGYDVAKDKPVLIINEQEAKLVRRIYGMYLDVSSILTTTVLLNEQGYTTKKRVSKAGKTSGGVKFLKNTIHRILMNPLYMGKASYNEQLYEGEHDAIIDEDLFEKVQDRIKYNRHDRKIRKNAQCAGLLSQLIRCKACDCLMIHTYSVKNKVKKYRYYVCLKAQQLGYATCPTRAVNAAEIEGVVMKHLPKVEIKDNPLLGDKYREILPKVLSIWDTLIANEKHRILKLFFTSIDYHAETSTLGFNLNEKGIYELYGEICAQNSK